MHGQVNVGDSENEDTVVTEELEESVHGSTNEMEVEAECLQCGCTFVDNVELDWHLEANHLS